MKEGTQIGKCVLCDFKTQSKGHHRKFRKNKSASEVIYERLYQHYEEMHLDVIMPVWMNCQASEGY